MPGQRQIFEESQQQDLNARLYAPMDLSGCFIDPSMLLKMPIEDGMRFLAAAPTQWLDGNATRPPSLRLTSNSTLNDLPFN